MTLNEIAYNIKNILEGGAATLDSNISIRQIQAMIHYHRAQLLLKYTDGGRYISSAITSKINEAIDEELKGRKEMDIQDKLNERINGKYRY